MGLFPVISYLHISQMHRISSDEVVAVLHISVKGTHHHALKLGVELLKLGGEFLPRKTEDFRVKKRKKKKTLSAAEWIQPFCQDLDRDKRRGIRRLPPTSGSVC